MVPVLWSHVETVLSCCRLPERLRRSRPRSLPPTPGRVEPVVLMRTPLQNPHSSKNAANARGCPSNDSLLFALLSGLRELRQPFGWVSYLPRPRNVAHPTPSAGDRDDVNEYGRQACVAYSCAASGRNAIAMRQLSRGASSSGPPVVGHVHSFPHRFGVPSKNVAPNHDQMFESPNAPPSPPPAAPNTVMSLTFVTTSVLQSWSPTATAPKFVCLNWMTSPRSPATAFAAATPAITMHAISANRTMVPPKERLLRARNDARKYSNWRCRLDGRALASGPPSCPAHAAHARGYEWSYLGPRFGWDYYICHTFDSPW
jgi:hypothetical protein